MQRFGILLVWLAAVLCGCGGALPRAAPPPRPVCGAAVVKGKPVFCFPKGSGELFVVGLPEAHGWDRGDWVMLDLPMEGLTEPVPVAMAVVMQRYPDLAQVQMLYQREAKSLDGARARRINKEDRARLGKFVGRITQVDLARVRIDVGVQDKAKVGDVYQVLSARDHQPIGRLQITEVGDLYAWAKRLDQREEFREGLDAVYLKDATGGESQPVLILVVNFDPQDPESGEELKAGRGFAKELSDALANAAKGSSGITVRYDGKERVRLGAGEEEGHKAARDIGKRFAADIVVWGSMRCDKSACALPRFTVVEPERLKERGYKGAEILIERDTSGFTFKGQAPEDPLALGAAILGSVAFDAQRYADASYYLGQAVSKNVLRGEDELRGRLRFAYAMYVRGQTALARQQAELLVQRAREQGEERWQQWGRGEFALMDQREGKVGSARVHLEAIRSWATKHGDADGLSFALHRLAALEADQGRVTEARALYQQLLELERRIGDVEGETATLHGLAVLDAQQGRVTEARVLVQQSLELARRIGNVRGEAHTLHELAILEARQGRVTEARALYQQTLELWRRVGDVEGEAATLTMLASLEADQGRVTEARALYQQSLELKRRIGDVQGEAATLHGLASLEADQGRVTEARVLYQQSLELKRRIGDAQGEAITLNQLAMLEAQQGRVTEARALHQQALELERRTGDVNGELASVVNLAVLDSWQGKTDAARPVLEEALKKARSIKHVAHQASILNLLGQIDQAQGNFTEARQRWTEALSLYEQLKMPAKVDTIRRRLAALPPTLAPSSPRANP
jgi:tetratricopeptide (TPR) repeat protein